MVELLPPTTGTEEGELQALFPEAKQRARRRQRFIGAALILVVLALMVGIIVALPGNGDSRSSSSAPSPVGVRTPGPSPILPFIVLTGDAGNDLQVQSGITGRTIKDLGPVNQFTGNGLSLAPDRRAVFVVVNRSLTLMVERVDLRTGEETFIGDGFSPAVSQDGRLLAYGSGAINDQTLVIKNLATGSTRELRLQNVLGQQTDLLNASIKWVGSRVVIIPAAVGNDLMGKPVPTPLKGSCSAIPRTSSCVVVVSTRGGQPLSAKKQVFNHVVLDSAVLGVAGPSALDMAVFKGDRTDVTQLDLSGGRGRITPLFSIPKALPQSFSTSGAQLYYLHLRPKGGLPVSLWRGRVTGGGLMNATQLYPNSRLSALAA
jgi:hypothetical protein